MGLQITSAFWKIKALKKKIKVIQGGQGASKTYSILSMFLLNCIVKTGSEDIYTVVTETYPQLRDGAIADMKNICKACDIDFDANFIKSENNLNIYGHQIQFRHLDNRDYHKAKGARRQYLFINEANRIAYQSIEQMMARTELGIYIDYNPDREFWVHEQLLRGGRDDVDFIILTYNDNECISAGERKEIEMRKGNSNWWRVYGLGELGVYSDRQIYSYDFIDEIPPDAKRVPSGMDFGLSPDPTTLINLYIKDNWLICDEVFTMNNLMYEKIPGSNRMSIVDKLNEISFPKGWLIIADSANATAIKSLRDNGYNVHSVKKDLTVIDGIGKVRGYDLKLTKRSTGIKKAIESWFFKVDQNGKVIPEPDGHEPDQLAAIRYVIMSKNKVW